MNDNQKDEYIAYLENILSKLPGNVYWKARDGRYLGCNENVAKAAKLKSPLDVRGKLLHEFFDLKYVDKLIETDERIMSNDQEETLEEIGPDLNGNLATYLTRKIPTHNDKGEVTGLIGISFDITTRKEIEEELKKTQQKLKETISHLETILSLIPGHVYWKDLHGRYIGCNDKLAQTLNLPSRAAILGKLDVDFIGTELAKQINKNDQEVINTGQEKSIEELYPSIDGNHPTFYFSQKAPLRNTAGEIIGLVGASFDITEQKKIENKLRNLQQQAELKACTANTYLDYVIENLPENFYWMDKHGLILGCSEKQATGFGFENAAALIGKSVYDIAKKLGTPKKLAQLIRQNDLEVMKHKKSIQKEEEILINGEKRIYLSYKNPLQNKHKKIIGVFGVSIDITERKKVEHQLQQAKERAEAANQAKSEFLAMLSHELRIPLTAILGMAQVIQYETNLSPEQKEQTDNIIKSGEHLLSLVNDLLDVSKLEAKKIELEPTNINLKTLIQGIYTTFAATAKKHNLKLLTQYEDNIPYLIVGDKRALQQILLNLVGNAIKFTKVGHILIKVDCIEANSTQALIRIHVEDTGIGISPDKIESIFERFNQADNSITRKFGGTGLGLTISKSYIELMKGTVTVNSKVGKGSTFICTIPFLLQQASQEPISTLSNPDNITINKKLKILLVEDDPIVEKVHTLMLKKSGYTVQHAATGYQAVAMAKDHFDVIFMDIGLPDISGYEATKQIRNYQKNQNQSHTFIIGLTGYAHEEYKIKCLEAGMDDVATKPIKFIELQKLLESYFKQ